MPNRLVHNFPGSGKALQIRLLVSPTHTWISPGKSSLTRLGRNEGKTQERIPFDLSGCTTR